MFTSAAAQWTKMKTEPVCSGRSEDKYSGLHSELSRKKQCRELTITTITIADQFQITFVNA